MKRPLLDIRDLYVSTDEKEILNGITLTIFPGQIHAIMGPNGAGKSTLSKVLAGHPAYTVTKGEISLSGESLISMVPEERAHHGLFLSFQNPVEVPGVSNVKFLRAAVNAIRKGQGQDPLSEDEIENLVHEKMELLGLKPDLASRDLNVGFSGGEKKRNEILQMAVLNPLVSILDEADSGLDIDAMKVVANGIKTIMSKEKGLLLITHYQRLLTYIVPDVVHVMVEGRIVATGGRELAVKLESEGYDWLMQDGKRHA